MKPSTSARTFTPISIAFGSLKSTPDTGAAGSHKLQGQPTATAVVNVHVTSAARRLPARSLTVPPYTRAVNALPVGSAADGVSRAVRVAES